MSSTVPVTGDSRPGSTVPERMHGPPSVSTTGRPVDGTVTPWVRLSWATVSGRNASPTPARMLFGGASGSASRRAAPALVPIASRGTARPSGSVDRSEAVSPLPMTCATQVWPVASVPWSRTVRTPSRSPAQRAAACVGRWRSGTPVCQARSADRSRSWSPASGPRTAHGSWAWPDPVAAGTGPSGAESPRRAGTRIAAPIPTTTTTTAATSHPRRRRGAVPAAVAEPAPSDSADAARAPPACWVVATPES